MTPFSSTFLLYMSIYKINLMSVSLKRSHHHKDAAYYFNINIRNVIGYFKNCKQS